MGENPMPEVLNEPKNLGEVLLYEEENYYYSRDEIIIAQDEVISIGQVLARDDDSGEYIALNLADGEAAGSDVAAAIAIRNIDATDEPVETVVLVRHCIVKRDGLVWPEEMTPEELVTAIEQLQALGILIRR